MIIAIDNRGSINIPASLRKELGLKSGDHLDVSLKEGGIILLQPIEIYPKIRLSEGGLAKLEAARESGTGDIPSWFAKALAYLETNPRHPVLNLDRIVNNPRSL